MGVKLKLAGGNAEPIRETIDLGESGSFVVLLRRPTWNELTEDAIDSKSSSVERRLGLVTGWEGMEEESEVDGQLQSRPLAFSRENLKRICEARSAIFMKVSAIANRVFDGRLESASKNSATVSGMFSADTVLQSMRSMPISILPPSGASPAPLEPMPPLSGSGTENSSAS